MDIKRRKLTSRYLSQTHYTNLLIANGLQHPEIPQRKVKPHHQGSRHRVAYVNSIKLTINISQHIISRTNHITVLPKTYLIQPKTKTLRKTHKDPQEVTQTQKCFPHLKNHVLLLWHELISGKTSAQIIHQGKLKLT